MFAGKDQRLVLFVQTDKNKVKKPGDPFDRQVGKEPASGLGWGHGQVDLAAAAAALPAGPLSDPAGREESFNRTGQPIVEEDKDHYETFKHCLIIISAKGARFSLPSAINI